MPATLDELLTGSSGATLDVRVRPHAPRTLNQVTLIEDLDSQDALLPGALGVLTRVSAEAAGGYQLDVLVRRAAEREVAGLVLRRSTRRSMTAEQLAARGRVALLDVDDDVDPAALVDMLGSAVAGDARELLARLAATARRDWSDDADVGDILSEISQVSGVDLMYDLADVSGFRVDVDGRIRGSVTTVDPRDVATVAARLAAALLTRVLTSRARDELQPMRSTSVLLAQLLLSSQANLPAVSRRALEVGLPLQDWHVAARMSLGATAGDRTDGPVELDEEVLGLIASLDADGPGLWSATRPDDTIVVIHSIRRDPRRTAVASMSEAVRTVVSQLANRHPSLQIRVGIGTAHQGLAGLRISAEEARTALASARLSGEESSMATFDTLGLQRMLAEWLVTDTARDTVSDLLAPLDALGPDKAAVAIETLHAYLDERGSLQRAAARLHLHRNAVVYRMGQINKELNLDLTDPDQRFALQLACRARLMTGAYGTPAGAGQGS